MRLLLDLGNTRLKWALQAPAQGLVAHDALDWCDDPAAALVSAWRDLPLPETIIAASVVDSQREAQMAAICTGLFGRAPIWLRTPEHACGVRNAYPEPERLGVDRFLAMVAARASHAGPCVVAGVGTALTLDALSADGQHLGGVIAPGPALMQQSLIHATAQIRPSPPGHVLELADNTADAVASGCWQAAAALVERFAVRMHPRLGAVPSLILGGGGAPGLLPLLSLSAQLSPHGVLDGLALWADANTPRSSAA